MDYTRAMAGAYRTKQIKSRSRFYILLSVVFVFVLFKWGIPFFVNAIAGTGVSRQNVDQDVIPPQAPIISALPEATNSSSILIEGFTEPNASLDVLINDKISVTDKAKEDGSFSVTATLDTGSNRVQVRATDEAGNISHSEVKIVIYDDKPIELTILSPKDGTEFFGKNSQIIDIKGGVSKADTQVIINNSFVIVEKDSTFTHRFQLQNGENTIKIVASDRAGNTAEKILTLIYTP